jgi:hypothetical protein
MYVLMMLIHQGHMIPTLCPIVEKKRIFIDRKYAYVLFCMEVKLRKRLTGTCKRASTGFIYLPRFQVHVFEEVKGRIDALFVSCSALGEQ